MRHVFEADGMTPANLDDMPTGIRALAILLEHANDRKLQGLEGICRC
jgi:hypothetical protein